MTVSSDITQPPVDDKKLTDSNSTTQPASEVKEEESLEKINWRRFREERAKERKEAESDRKRLSEKEKETAALKAAMEALLSKPEKHAQETETSESDEQRLSRIVRSEIENDRKNQERERIARESRELPQVLQRSFPDYNNVCNEENVDYLEYHYPEVVAGFKHMPDGFEKWSTVYKAIKRFVPNPDSKKDEKRIEKNLSKPQSMSLPGMTSTGDHPPVVMDEKRRQDNYARMQRIIRGGK